MGALIHWSNDPPRKLMASLLARLLPEFEKRGRVKKVVQEGLTRGGCFLVGLLLAWLWMMLIGRNVTNRCWLPGTILRWRHGDASNKVLDVRLSGIYNGSSIVPFNASIEEGRRISGAQRRQRCLLQREGWGAKASKLRDGDRHEAGLAVSLQQSNQKLPAEAGLFNKLDNHSTIIHRVKRKSSQVERRLNEEESYGVRSAFTPGLDGTLKEDLVRPHPRTRLRNLVFGIAATAATWNERKEVMRLWWDATRLRGFVWMDTPDLSKGNCTNGNSAVQNSHVKASLLWEAHIASALRSLNRTCGSGKKIDYSWMDKPDPELPPVIYSANFSQYAYTHPTGLRSAIRVARVVVEMYRVEQTDVLWYVMGDDDTIFSPPNLVAVLSKYDPREMVYIGAPSESHLQNVEFSNEMGYGGGGFAISFALAKRLADIQDECLHRYPEVYGSDARVQACLAELGVHMKKERGFHQYDLLGNVAGALEGHPIAPFLSMHHVAVLQPVFPRMTQMGALAQLTKTMKRHPLEFLQQTMCLNQAEKFSISIAWGYSVRWYPDYIRPSELERPQRTFRAWNRGRDPFDFDMDTRNTPVTPCRVPSLFYVSGALSRTENGQLLLETRYRRTVTDWTEPSSTAEDGTLKSRKERKSSSGACSKGEVHLPQRDVSEVRVLAPPLTSSWVLAPRRQCCHSVEVIGERTVEIRLGMCRENEIIA